MRWSRWRGPSPRSSRISALAAGSTCRPLGVVRPRRRPRRLAGTEPGSAAPAAAAGATSPGSDRPPAGRSFSDPDPPSPDAAPEEGPGPDPEGRSAAIRTAPRMAPRGREVGGGSGEPSSCGAGPTSPSCFLRGGGRDAAGGAFAPGSNRAVAGAFREPRPDGGKPTAPLTPMQFPTATAPPSPPYRNRHRPSSRATYPGPRRSTALHGGPRRSARGRGGPARVW